MKKITEKEEKEMYDIIEEALLSLCNEKPNNPVEYLSKKMLTLIHDNSEFFKKRIVCISKGNTVEEVNVNLENFSFGNANKKFSESYKVLNPIGMGSHGSAYEVQDADRKSVV